MYVTIEAEAEKGYSGGRKTVFGHLLPEDGSLWNKVDVGYWKLKRARMAGESYLGGKIFE